MKRLDKISDDFGSEVNEGDEIVFRDTASEFKRMLVGVVAELYPTKIKLAEPLRTSGGREVRWAYRSDGVVLRAKASEAKGGGGADADE